MVGDGESRVLPSPLHVLLRGYTLSNKVKGLLAR